jgi:hypothetical protein
MKRDYRKLMDQKARAKSRSRKYIYAGTTVATGLLLGLTPIAVATPFFTVQSGEVQAAVIDGQLFSNLTSSNSSGTTSAAPFPLANANRNVNFTISGNSGIDVSVLPGTKRAVLAIPEGLRGCVTPNGAGTFSTSILLPENGLVPLISIVDGATTTLINAVDALINANPVLNINLAEVNEQLNLLRNLSTINSADVALQLQAQGDQYIYADLDGVLETIIRQN